MVIDMIKKSVHFITIKVIDLIQRLANLYSRDVVKLHRILATIVSDRDPQFISRFWMSLQNAMEAKLNFSTIYISDGQSERTIQILDDMLRMSVIDFRG
jgi:hypothetical protein